MQILTPKLSIKEVIKEVSKVKGWFAECQQYFLYPFVRELPPNSLLVEIGTSTGRSTRFYSLSNPEIRIITIDIIPYEVTRSPEYEGTDEDVNILADTQVTQLVGDSGVLGVSFKEPIDFLFIDGDHHYEGIKRDIEVWTPLVKVGGLIVFHDCGKNDEHNSVERAIREWLLINRNFVEVALKVNIMVVKRVL